MKRPIVFIAILLGLVGVGVASRSHSRSGSSPSAKAPTRPTSTSASAPASTTKPASLGVEQFMKNVDAHRSQRGPLLIEGIVSAASADKKVLAIIDRSEYEHCGVTTCAAYTLPVSWSGTMPSPKALVRVSGQIKETGGKLIFVADSVQVTTRPEASK